MFYTTRDLQARVNALSGTKVLIVDGMSGPNTRAAVKETMRLHRKTKEKHLFDDSGLHGVIWHWTAGLSIPSELDRDHYNDLFDKNGNQYDGAARPEHQANYDWRKGVGVSHTRNANTGRIGLAVAGMAGAEGWPKLKWGHHQLTWEGIDAMLERTALYSKKFWIPVSPWSTLSHAEVQQTLGIQQKNKWDYMVLPGDSKVRDAVEVGNILRHRLKDKFL
jgi:hypothetical protein